MKFYLPDEILNGSGTKNLVTDWERAAKLLQHALAALPFPHPRDYLDGMESAKYSESMTHVSNLYLTIEAMEQQCAAIRDQFFERYNGGAL